MRSAIALTEEIDDMDLAAEELVGSIRKKLGDLDKASVGLVYCDADVDVASLSEKLHEALGCDVVGLTTTAVIEKGVGYSDMGISLCVMTGDDVEFAVGSTEPLAVDDYASKIRAAYRDARSRLKSDPKLIIMLAPFIAEITSEHYVDVLDEESHGVPIFGGVASDHYDLQYHKTFCSGSANDSVLRVLLIAGDIHPVFAMKHRFSDSPGMRGVITKSEKNHVYKVDDETFEGFLSKMTSIPEDESVVFHFGSTPFVVELPDHLDGEEPVVRDLYRVEHRTGAGIFLSDMPEGSKLSISVLDRGSLRDSCGDTLDTLVKKMREQTGGQFSTVLVSTCNARHVLMGDNKRIESDLVSSKLSEYDAGINAMGFYAFGEFCPTTPHEGGTRNRFHNVSFALCAF